MVKSSKLIFIRHAKVETVNGCFPENNPNAIINECEIKNLANHLPQDCNWYVSPLKRTIQTAEALSRFVTVKKIILEKKLLEQNFGDWAGKNISEVWQDLKKNKSQHNYSFICPETSPPKGESFLVQYQRISKWLEKMHFFEPQTLIIIAHAGTIRGVLAYILGIDLDKAIGIEILHLSLTSLEVLTEDDNKDRGGRFRVLGVNNQVV